jgi:ABC-2 type transport system permease protein
MNLFLKELKAYRKGLFFWSLGMLFLVGASMGKFASYQTSGQSITALFDQFPKNFQVIFGLSGFDITTVAGFYGVTFLYISLMASVHAVLLATDIISKEERDRTSEFLFVKPISRVKVISLKLAAGLVNLVVFNLITLIVSVYFVGYFNKGTSATNIILVLMAGLFLLQLIFFFSGTAIASLYKNPKHSPSIAMAVLLTTFILSFLVAINSSLNSLKYLTPFKYFDAHAIISSSQLDPLYVVISLLLIAILVMTTYKAYINRDLST